MVACKRKFRGEDNVGLEDTLGKYETKEQIIKFCESNYGVNKPKRELKGENEKYLQMGNCK